MWQGAPQRCIAPSRSSPGGEKKDTAQERLSSSSRLVFALALLLCPIAPVADSFTDITPSTPRLPSLTKDQGFWCQIETRKHLALLTEQLARSQPLQYEVIICGDALTTEGPRLKDQAPARFLSSQVCKATY